MSRGLVVGIDGGATRTRYLLLDPPGDALGRSEGRASLLGAGEDEAVVAALVAETRVLVERAGQSLPVEALCAGLAGAAGRPHAARETRDRLLEAGIARRVRITTDAEVAFVDAFGSGGGILVIGGTGSIGLARGPRPSSAGGGGAAVATGASGAPSAEDADGGFVRVGGWGALLGDEGSAYGIGLAGLRGAIRGREGRGPATRLDGALFGALALGSVAELLEWTREVAKAPIAALAPVVVAEAEAGDEVAETIVADAVASLVRHAVALRRAVGEGAGSTVALVGGLVEPGGPLHPRVTAALAAEGMTALDRLVDGARGAARMAERAVAP